MRLQVDDLMSKFNASLMDILGNYHSYTIDRCDGELNAIKEKLVEQQRELDYRSGVILRLEKEKDQLQSEMEGRVLEARKIASFEHLDLRPSPAYNGFSASLSEKAPVATAPPQEQQNVKQKQKQSSTGSSMSHSPPSKDLESVISRLKKQKNPKQRPRNQESVQPATPPPSATVAPPSSTQDASKTDESTSVLAQALVPEVVVPETSTVTVTESVIEIKQEVFDVDDNDEAVLDKQQVTGSVTPEPMVVENGQGVDTVDDVPSTSSSSSSSSSSSLSSSLSSRQEPTDTGSEVSQGGFDFRSNLGIFSDTFFSK